MMKWILSLCLLLAAATSAQAITLLWDYPDPPADLAGFRLYVNGVAQVPTIPADARSYVFPTTIILAGGNNLLGLTAFDAVGNESDPATLTYNPPPPAVTGFRLEVPAVVH